MSDSTQEGMMTFGGHLEVLRKMLFRVIGVIAAFAVVIFCFKDITFDILLAPQNNHFVTFEFIEWLAKELGWNFRFPEYDIKLISTDLSAQFMTHISTSLYLGLLMGSPFLVYELFRFILPALYDDERKHSVKIALSIYGLFIIGILLSYFLLFPISFQFLANYQVDSSIENTITLSSYISTFVTLSFMMGVVFQLPVICFFMAKMGLVSGDMLARYKKHAFIVILVIAAIITPPDAFTLVIVTLPMYLLYLLGVLIAKRVQAD